MYCLLKKKRLLKLIKTDNNAINWIKSVLLQNWIKSNFRRNLPALVNTVGYIQPLNNLRQAWKNTHSGTLSHRRRVCSSMWRKTDGTINMPHPKRFSTHCTSNWVIRVERKFIQLDHTVNMYEIHRYASWNIHSQMSILLYMQWYAINRRQNRSPEFILN